KYDWLSTHDVNSTDWKEIEPQKPFSLFIPQDNEFLQEYEKEYSIKDIFGLSNAGMVTARDALTIHNSKDDILKTIVDFSQLSVEEAQTKYKLCDDTRDWKIHLAQKDLKKSGLSETKITKILYRPFDILYTYYTGTCKGFHSMPRTEVMQHMLLGDNLGLITVRQVAEGIFSHALVTESIIDNRLTLSNKGYAQLFPLYLYPDTDNPQQSTTEEKLRPNFSDEFLTEITNKLGCTPTPEAIFYYIYAIFHSPTYRTRYAEFLKIDFPRVPLTSDDQLFRKLGEYGEELVALHLMKSPKLDQHLTQINDKGGEFVVDAGHPKYSDGEVIINKKGDRFTGVPKSVWEFYVGGYQVCHKWLKDRKGRQLSPEDLNHY
ncbi:MAG: type ISP restriction/modification enzyme, partial [Pseudanabaena sp.]